MVSQILVCLVTGMLLVAAPLIHAQQKRPEPDPPETKGSSPQPKPPPPPIKKPPEPDPPGTRSSSPQLQTPPPPMQKPQQPQFLTQDTIKLLQERLTAEKVYAGPVDGVINAETEAALRAYQQQRGLGVSGAPDEPTLQELQIRLPTSPGGDR